MSNCHVHKKKIWRSFYACVHSYEPLRLRITTFQLVDVAFKRFRHVRDDMYIPQLALSTDMQQTEQVANSLHDDSQRSLKAICDDQPLAIFQCPLNDRATT